MDTWRWLNTKADKQNTLAGHQGTIADKNIIVLQLLILQKPLGEMSPLFPEVLPFTK